GVKWGGRATPARTPPGEGQPRPDPRAGRPAHPAVRAGAARPPSHSTGIPTHQFYKEQLQIDGGRMDRFVAWGASDGALPPANPNGLVMSYYDATQLPLGQLALRYTLADRFFRAAFGGSFLKPLGTYDEHPGYTGVLPGEEHAADLIERIMASPYWARSAIVLTYDENGDRWDHVAPPVKDRWGP